MLLPLRPVMSSLELSDRLYHTKGLLLNPSEESVQVGLGFSPHAQYCGLGAFFGALAKSRKAVYWPLPACASASY